LSQRLPTFRMPPSPLTVRRRAHRLAPLLWLTSRMLTFHLSVTPRRFISQRLLLRAI
jgi:hypothetical protein